MPSRLDAHGQSNALWAALHFCPREGTRSTPLITGSLASSARFIVCTCPSDLKTWHHGSALGTCQNFVLGPAPPMGRRMHGSRPLSSWSWPNSKITLSQGAGPTYTSALTRSPLRCCSTYSGLVAAPPQVVRAYQSFHTAIVYHNSVAGTLGKPHRHFCGIPQGCPLSMTWTAFMLVPWVHQLRTIHCIPRALADDILVVAQRPISRRTFPSRL